MKVYAFVQSRMSSKRLPGKALLPLLGKPLIVHIFERIKRSRYLNDVVLLTSAEIEDDALVKDCQSNNINVFRGDLNDVLKRFADAARLFGLQKEDRVVRITGDNPICDPHLIDEVIDLSLQGDFDFASNAAKPIYPDGLDVGVMKAWALYDSDAKADKPSQREHMTQFLIHNSQAYRLGHVEKTALHTNWRLTIDNQEDYELIKIIYEHFGSNDFVFGEVVSFLESNPSLIKLNSHFRRNEALEKVENEKP